MSRPNGTTVPARASARTEERPLQPRDTADVREIVREAGNRTAPLRIRAGGSWMDAGCPVEPCTELDLSQLRGIREYTPGDLTLTAGPATTLAEIGDATGSHGQWLLLDPVGGGLGTLGASLATASCGPLAASGGQPRDLTLGVEFVDGRGTVVRGGGRVVKNVAGFDLVRLLVGSWGTLGVITEVTVRLRALPECERTVAVPAPADRETLATLLRALRSAPADPLSAELLDARLARALDIDDRAVVLVRLAGNEPAVRAQHATLAALGGSRELPRATWERLRGLDTAGGWSLRISRRPSELAHLWHAVHAACGSLNLRGAHATLARGVMRVFGATGDAGPLATLAGALQREGTVVGERLPPGAWSVLHRAPDRLTTRVRDAFDPFALLNRGIMGGSA